MLTYGCADMSSTALIDPLLVIDFVTQLLNKDVSFIKYIVYVISDIDKKDGSRK